MPNRITGLATGIDVDSLVSAELSGYKSKITKEQQKKDILAIQQELYRGVITQGSDFYSKYLDLTKEGNLLSSKTYATTTFTSSDEKSITAKSVSGSAIKDNYKVSVEQLASPASVVLDMEELKKIADKKIFVEVGGEKVEIDISSITDSGKSDDEKQQALVNALNNKLSSKGLKAAYSKISGGVILKSEKDGADQSFKILDSSDNVKAEGVGKNCKYKISSSTSGGEKSFESSSNTVTVDGIEFSFISETSSPVTISGKTDASSITDQIVNFFDDYNTMLTNLQTLITEKHDRNYSPLTEEQKTEMSESQVSKWEAKVKQGQLHNDSILQNFVNQMKSALSAKTKELSKMGITLNKEYGTKAGTYTVDKDKLKAAIEEDPEGMMKLFMATEKTTKDSDGKDVAIEGSGGIFTSMKGVIYNNTVSTTKSALISKAGTELFNSNSTITKQINKFAKSISQMQTTLSSKEQKLYSKYATLETIMNKYNNQLSNLQSYFS